MKCEGPLPSPSGDFTAQSLQIYLRFYYKCNFEELILQLQNFGTCSREEHKSWRSTIGTNRYNFSKHSYFTLCEANEGLTQER